MEAKEELCCVIETALALKEKFSPEYLINVMIGRATDEVKSFNHDSMEVFGCMKGTEEKILSSVIKQGAIAGYLAKEVENYGIIHVTPKGRKFLSNPVSFKIVEDTDFAEVESEPPMKGGAACAVDPALYSMLKDLRKKIAKKADLPPYVIFQEPSLEAMATNYPVTIEELAGLPGVGAGKARRYGQEFVSLIKRHVEENEIERPEDLRVRSVANKSKLKIAIIHSIDRKIDLEELAENKGLEFNELIDELEGIVEAGTKINIDYFLHEIMDEDHEQDIIDYFRENQEDDLEAAIQELGDEFTEEEIRLVRVKFLSEMGN